MYFSFFDFIIFGLNCANTKNMRLRNQFPNHLMPSGYFFIILAALLITPALTSCHHESTRKVISLNGEWQFYIDSASVATSVSPGESGLLGMLTRPVSVPHAWNADKGLETYWGKCWYERSFEVTKKQLSGITRLQFDAVYHDAIIYVNGQKAGEHRGSGYTRFFVDVTPFIKAGENLLTVCADNSPSRRSIPFLKSYDWANDGGIIRSVYEVITGKQAIRSIHVTAIPTGEKGRAEVSVGLLDKTDTGKTKLTVMAVITEENQTTQHTVFNGELEGNFVNGEFHSVLNFDKIHPWHFDSPALYKLDIRLLDDGVEKDALSTTFGFRSIKVEDNRYVLNGEPVRLMGVEWMPGSSPDHGMAETHADLEKNLDLMKKANCIFTRFPLATGRICSRLV